ncbi:hypothetical protein [Cellulomonas fimi]|uniref:Alpha/beta hydrolase n=1 Tax=Cellulomonas fimi (strain ATCC 484 / DSM 20113 / JCM 1341 / CCUG 24087 / LMG 16345 / NBRC 15513 / NCIMB 8980 / NCTC 7547 / NRS-133) TaxID=590998 RepID=F4H0F6_CELFA|nr:hypothetical protein [Cellulomonas fimi]AEE47325.1 hypothetical protein Celf_3211 [Cellulomonas fimi ATCC 484]NNH05846.1 hypothetical protein [Cellulomonas fimi]VEH35927.1 Uncharacterised protein [Cellulomonas fimi]
MRWLVAHADATPLAGPATARAVWLTGQSSWRHSQLSPGQLAVLDTLAAHGWEPLRVGFPWTERAAAEPYRREPLLAASARNARQWAAARPGSRFARHAADHLQVLLDRTATDLLLLCGSAGARVLASAAPSLRTPAGLRVHVVGLGPVGALPVAGSGWSVHVVRGRSDLLSRWGHRGAADVVVPGGHLVAATSPAAVAAVLHLVGPPSGAASPAPSAAPSVTPSEEASGASPVEPSGDASAQPSGDGRSAAAARPDVDGAPR